MKFNCSLEDRNVYRNLRILVRESPLNQILRVVMIKDLGALFPVEIFITSNPVLRELSPAWPSPV